MKPEDRRESARLLPKDQTYVAVRPDFTLLGKMVDISKGGLCFRYLPSRGEELRQGAGLDMDIFVRSNGFYLPDVHCRLVYHDERPEDPKAGRALKYRRCGVQFDRLSEEQERQVFLFLEKHAEKADTADEGGGSDGSRSRLQRLNV